MEVAVVTEVPRSLALTPAAICAQTAGSEVVVVETGEVVAAAVSGVDVVTNLLERRKPIGILSSSEPGPTKHLLILSQHRRCACA